jgi:NTE family protein
LHDLRLDAQDALARVARRLAGRSVGLVLSGGGARGLAHLGVVAALEDHGVVIDRWGGTSMGALVAAAYASGRTTDEIVDALRRELVQARPFRDLAVPRHGLIRAQRAGRMLERLLGGVLIEELDRPFFCVSCDLHSATEVVHRTGPLKAAVGASMRIPGFAPPLPLDGRLLVDGGVLNNLPVDVMVADEEGPVVAVDVMRPFGTATPAAVPGLLETVGRSMVLGSWQKAARNRDLADLVVTPDLGDVGMFDWRRLDELVTLGRRAAEAAMASSRNSYLAG